MLGKKGLQRIKKYVESGGYLFAEDWCMEEIVGKLWSDRVAMGYLRKEEAVPVLPKAGASTHPYLKKIFFKPPQVTRRTVTEGDLVKLGHTWKIDADSRTIRIKDPKRVVTLLTSPTLEKTARGDDAVAITFIAGGKEAKRPAVATSGAVAQDRSKMKGGRVLYVLSHFGKQESEDGEYALQNLLINFLVEAAERRAEFKAPK